MAASAPDAVERTIRIGARPPTVFAFFTDPEKMVQWKGVEAQLEPKPGGLYRVNVTGRDVARGEYVEVSPYTRIVFTWGWESEGNPVRPGSSTVEVTFTPDGDGTIVRLVHSGLPAETSRGHSEGWDHYLERLASAAGGSNPGPDPWAQNPL
ncbi:MAG: SRPBCC family protein [Chloroflexota bacterium]